MIRPQFSARLAAAAALLIMTSTVHGQDRIRTEAVHFDRGANSTTIKHRIVGYEIIDYVLGAREGQLMSVSMATDNPSSYFNILAPGEDEVAMFVGSTSGNQYEGSLPATGDYKVRVYMMRNAARRNETANYRLEMLIDGAGASHEAHDARVEGTPYHATGELPCSGAQGQPTRSCAFGVVRQGGGSATVTVTKPDGNTRDIFFENGKAVGSDGSEADGAFASSQESDLIIVRVGYERYEIPDIVVLGD